MMIDMQPRMIRVDRNGTQYWQHYKCPKCGGKGYIPGYEMIEGGRCFECDGSGRHDYVVKIMTPEHQAKLEQRRIARERKKAGEKNARFFNRYGLDASGTAWAVVGETYSIREELKAAGATYNYVYGWHFDHPEDRWLCVKVEIDKVAWINEIGMYVFETEASQIVQGMIQDILPFDGSDWVGEVGAVLEREVALVGVHTYETSFTWHGEIHNILKFRDDGGNMLIWNTTSYCSYNVGDRLVIKGRIKEHSEYKGRRQTELIRCRLSAV